MDRLPSRRCILPSYRQPPQGPQRGSRGYHACSQWSQHPERRVHMKRSLACLEIIKTCEEFTQCAITYNPCVAVDRCLLARFFSDLGHVHTTQGGAWERGETRLHTVWLYLTTYIKFHFTQLLCTVQKEYCIFHPTKFIWQLWLLVRHVNKLNFSQKHMIIRF